MSSIFENLQKCAHFYKQKIFDPLKISSFLLFWKHSSNNNSVKNKEVVNTSSVAPVKESSEAARATRSAKTSATSSVASKAKSSAAPKAIMPQVSSSGAVAPPAEKKANLDIIPKKASSKPAEKSAQSAETADRKVEKPVVASATSGEATRHVVDLVGDSIERKLEIPDPNYSYKSPDYNPPSPVYGADDEESVVAPPPEVEPPKQVVVVEKKAVAAAERSASIIYRSEDDLDASALRNLGRMRDMMLGEMNMLFKELNAERNGDKKSRLYARYMELANHETELNVKMKKLRGFVSSKRDASEETGSELESQVSPIVLKRSRVEEEKKEAQGMNWLSSIPAGFDPGLDTIESFGARFTLFFKAFAITEENKKLQAVAAAITKKNVPELVEVTSNMLQEISSFEEFLTRLEDVYPQNAACHQVDIYSITQGSRSVKAYTEEFRRVAAKALLSDNPMLSGVFYNGLNESAKAQLAVAARPYRKKIQQMEISYVYELAAQLSETPSQVVSSSQLVAQKRFGSGNQKHSKFSRSSSNTSSSERASGGSEQKFAGPQVMYACKKCESFSHWFYNCPKNSQVENELLKKKYKKSGFEPLPVMNDINNKRSNTSAYTVQFTNLSYKQTDSIDFAEFTQGNWLAQDIVENKQSSLDSSSNKDNPISIVDDACLNSEDTMLCALLAPDEKQELNVPDPYFLPVEINGHACQAIVDPGTGVSVLSRTLVENLKLSVKKTSVTLCLADKRVPCPPSLGSVVADISCYEKLVKSHQFFVLDLNAAAQCLIGRDIFYQLGNEMILAMPRAKVLSLSPVRDGDIDPDDAEPLIGPVESDDEKYQSIIIESIKNEIKGNESLPEDGFCNLAYSRVQFKLSSHVPVCVPQYPIAYHLLPKVKEKVMDWLARKKIVERKEMTPYNLPLTVAPKRDEQGGITGVRVCLDLRKLNEILDGEGFQTIDVNAVLQKYNGSVWFSEIDLSEAYLQLEVVNAHQEYLTFTFDGKQYSFRGAPFGAKHLTAFFQKVMNQLFADCDFVNIYVDNVGVMSKTFETHVEHCKQVLQRLTKAGLKINPKKCQWARRWIRTLGRIVSKDGIRPDPSKIEGILKMRFPQSAKEVQTFLGVVNYMRDHIQGSANLTARFDEVRDVVRYKQVIQDPAAKVELEQDFKNIKLAMAKLLVLTFPDYKLPFHLMCDASDVAMGAVLFQKKEGKSVIIAVASQKFKKYEKRYTVHKKELRALVFGLSKFRNHIWCSPHQILVYTDHQALQNIYNASELPRTFSSWLNIITDFDLKVSHVPGKDNVLADALSRLSCMVMTTRRSGEKSVPKAKPNVVATSDDSESNVIAVEQSRAESMPAEESDNQTFKAQVDMTARQKKEMVKYYHSFGHFGREATAARLKMAGYSWPKMRQDIDEEIKQCDACLKYNSIKPVFHELKTTSVSRPWQVVQADLISSVKQHGEFVAILIVKCCFSGYVVLRALRNKSASEVSQKLFDMFSLYGPPLEIQADGGKEFTNELINEVWDKLGIKRRFHTPYNPRAQGVVENAIRPISTSIWKELRGQTDWPSILTKVEFCFNTRYSAITKDTPFYLMFGRNFWGTKEPDSENMEGEETWNDEWEKLRKSLYPTIAVKLTEQRNKQNKYFNDRHQLRKQDLKRGTTVMIKDMNRTSKDTQKFVGPYRIIRRKNDGCYAIEDPDGLYASTVPLNHMKVVSDSDIEEDKKQEMNADDEVVNDWYEVEEILDHKGSSEDRYYLVKWKNYPKSESTWEPVDHVADDDCIQRYWKKRDQSEKASQVPTQTVNNKSSLKKRGTKRKSNH